MTRRKYTDPMTLAQLKLLNEERKIWMNPEYQRGEVWTKAQKRLLLDSLLGDIDIPKIYLREVAKPPYEFEVVDGQQRLRSVFDFLDDKLSLAPDADPVAGEDVAGKTYKQLPGRVQIILTSKSLDVTRLVDYSNDDVEDMFLRLQNGTPLNAAEKRRALPSKLRKVVETLSRHKLFTLVGFSNNRFGYEDAAAKSLRLHIGGDGADIKPDAIARMYRDRSALTMRDPEVKSLQRTWNFIVRAFVGHQNPRLKKYAVLTLTSVCDRLLTEYDLGSHKDEFAKAYLDFEARRIANSELEDDLREPDLSNYTEAARNDSVEAMALRAKVLTRQLIAAIPTLRTLDPTRLFTDEQRLAIFHRDQGTCQACHEPAEAGNWHADHIVPHSKGGPTSISNGQLLHVDCNLHKAANVEPTEA